MTDDLLHFADEPESRLPQEDGSGWKILIADDDREVHTVTRLVLRDFQFEGRGLQFFSSFSAVETREIMQANPDMAMLLLDMVMETETSGIDVARFVREELGNHFVRIILRTGQPGQAPENQLISRYDINDYKEKTELTARKLFTVTTASIRSFRDLQTVERARRGLAQIVKSSSRIFEIQSFPAFARDVLVQLSQLLQVVGDPLDTPGSGVILRMGPAGWSVAAGVGRYAGSEKAEVAPAAIMDACSRALAERSLVFLDHRFVGYFKTRKSMEMLLYFENGRPSTRLEQNLVSTFATNITTALDNLHLNQEIIQTQREVIFTLGEVLDTRSGETAHHVRRVGEMAAFLSRLHGRPEHECELIRMAAPMHDVGKIGIPDRILLKPDPLTPEEFLRIQEHTLIGFNILKHSGRDIMQSAALIALQHHEKWDGSGYPHHLSGQEIHLFARITAIADVLDALLHPRPYKHAWTAAEVRTYLEEQSGVQFDPGLVDLLLAHFDDFLEIISSYPQPEA